MSIVSLVKLVAECPQKGMVQSYELITIIGDVAKCFRSRSLAHKGFVFVQTEEALSGFNLNDYERAR